MFVTCCCRTLRYAMLLAWLWLAISAQAGASDSTLPDSVARIARALEVPARDISIWVADVDADRPRLAVNADQPRNPASTMKLVTTFAALQQLTPAYRWQTEVYTLGEIVDGTLEGDLLIRGRGDPYMVSEEFWKLVSAVRRTGLQHITGDLVFDTSHFDLPAEARGAFDGQPHRVYNLPPHPLLVNFNAVRFEFTPTAEGVQVSPVPSLTSLVVDNQLQLAARPCVGYQRGVALHVQGDEARNRVALEGSFPANCPHYALTRAVLQPESYAADLFRHYWTQQDGTLAGDWRRGQLPITLQGVDGLPSAGSAEPLYVHHSRPLGEIVRLVNKYSNNVMTRHLYLTLGAEHSGPPATPAKANLATRTILTQAGFDSGGMVIGNAAGLSRESRLSARQLGELLQLGWQGPFMPEFVSSLALNGLDGTLTGRLADTGMRGQMHLKTGTLDHVSAIAGYLQTDQGERRIVVVLINSPDAHRGAGEEIQDALLRWAMRQ